MLRLLPLVSAALVVVLAVGLATDSAPSHAESMPGSRQDASSDSAPTPPPGQEITFAFWNVENLFDTDDDPDHWGDDEYLPAKGWTDARYELKLSRLADVLEKTQPHLLGVAEIENRRVLDDLVARPRLEQLGYRVAHVDSPDKRGIDCALIYRAPFEAGTPLVHPIAIDPPTRGVFEVPLTANGHTLTVLVNHWPSRGGGDKTVPQRALAGETARKIVDQRVKDAEAKGVDADILLMGDLNDEPFDLSVTKHLGAIRSRNAVLNRTKQYSLYNPSWKFLGQPDVGTYYYNREWRWNVLDQAILSRGMLKTEGFVFVDGSLEAYGPDELRDKYRRPLRFRRQGKRWIEGFSDHLLIHGKIRIAPAAGS